jgi:hypothetical protein
VPAAHAHPGEPLRLSARVPRHEPGPLARVLSPLLWMKSSLDDLRDAILHMVWGELLHGERDHDQRVHLGAFLIFSLFCLLAYAGVEDRLVLCLYALWPLDHVVSRSLRAGTGHDRVSLRQERGDLVWQRQGRGSEPRTERFPAAQARAVLVRFVDEPVGAFGSVRAQAWQVYLTLHGGAEHVLWSVQSAPLALRRATDLGTRLGIPVEVEHSNGSGPLAEVQAAPLWAPERDGMWRSRAEGGSQVIYTGIRTLDHRKLARQVLEEAGSLLLLAVMAGFMTRYGMFLTWMLGPSLGLSSPFALHLDLSVGGLLGLFAPDWGLETGVVLAVTAGALAHSLWRHAQPRRLVVSGRGLHYAVRGRTVAALAGTATGSVLLVHTPGPTLVVAAPDGRSLVVEDLYDGEGQEELYAKLTHAVGTVLGARAAVAAARAG